MGYRHPRRRKRPNDLAWLILEEWRVGLGLVVLAVVAAFWSFAQVSGNPDPRANAFLEQLFPRFAWVFEYSLPLTFLALAVIFLWATWISWTRSQERHMF